MNKILIVVSVALTALVAPLLTFKALAESNIVHVDFARRDRDVHTSTKPSPSESCVALLNTRFLHQQLYKALNAAGLPENTARVAEVRLRQFNDYKALGELTQLLTQNIRDKDMVFFGDLRRSIDSFIRIDTWALTEGLALLENELAKGHAEKMTIPVNRILFSQRMLRYYFDNDLQKAVVASEAWRILSNVHVALMPTISTWNKLNFHLAKVEAADLSIEESPRRIVSDQLNNLWDYYKNREMALYRVNDAEYFALGDLLYKVALIWNIAPYAAPRNLKGIYERASFQLKSDHFLEILVQKIITTKGAWPAIADLLDNMIRQLALPAVSNLVAEQTGYRPQPAPEPVDLSELTHSYLRQLVAIQ